MGLDLLSFGLGLVGGLMIFASGFFIGKMSSGGFSSLTGMAYPKEEVDPGGYYGEEYFDRGLESPDDGGLPGEPDMSEEALEKLAELHRHTEF